MKLLKRDLTLTFDGPAASGKTTLASLVASKLNLRFLSTGLPFRGLAWLLQQSGIEIKSSQDLDGFLQNHEFSLKPIILDASENFLPSYRLFIDSMDVHPHLQDPSVADKAAVLAEASYVQSWVVTFMAPFLGSGIVLEGRNAGTTFLPSADVKFFITADQKVRAKRRFQQYKKQGQELSEEEVFQQLVRRDEMDLTRESDPLRVPLGAIVIDNSRLSLEESLEVVLLHLRDGGYLDK